MKNAYRRSIKKRIKSAENHISKQRNDIATIEDEIERLETELKKRIFDTNKSIERCQTKWFRPKWMKKFNSDKIKEIRYWTT